MSTKWEPEEFDSDPMANALLNIAASINRQAEATENLLYAFKYSQRDGLSVAEALEASAKEIASGLSSVAASLEDGLSEVSRCLPKEKD